MWRRAEKFLKLFDYGVQSTFEDISESELTASSWLDTLFARMDMMVGAREDDDLRRAGRKAFFEATREPKESLTQYVSRRDAELQEAEGHDLWMNSKLKGLLLEEGAGLTAQGTQNLRTLTQGRLDFGSVTWALRQMGAGGSERLLPGRQGQGAVLASSATEDSSPVLDASAGPFQPSSRPPHSSGRSE
eukprot:5959028-Pyramimonas_sp.AAC.1